MALRGTIYDRAEGGDHWRRAAGRKRCDNSVGRKGIRTALAHGARREPAEGGMCSQVPGAPQPPDKHLATRPSVWNPRPSGPNHTFSPALPPSPLLSGACSRRHQLSLRAITRPPGSPTARTCPLHKLSRAHTTLDGAVGRAGRRAGAQRAKAGKEPRARSPDTSSARPVMRAPRAANPANLARCPSHVARAQNPRQLPGPDVRTLSPACSPKV